MRYDPDDMLTVSEAAAVLRCGPEAIRDMCEAGRLPSVQKGVGTARRHRVIRYQSLMAALREQEQQSVAAVVAAAQVFARPFVPVPLAQSRYAMPRRKAVARWKRGG